MNILVIGAGHIGLVTAACLADAGNQIQCVAEDDDDLSLLIQGQLDVFEPELSDVIKRCQKRQRLNINHWENQVLHAPDIIILAVACRRETGAADFAHAQMWLERLMPHIQRDVILVNRSTLPPGSTHELCFQVNKALRKNRVHASVECAYYPEFLSEGTAVHDFTHPDKIILGLDSPFVEEKLLTLLKPFYRNRKAPITMSVTSAELGKYATNAMLATRITFINEMARLCDQFNSDISEVRKALAADPRIGPNFLIPGLGFAGTTFPKDISSLVQSARETDSPFLLLEAVEQANQRQKTYLLHRLERKWEHDWSHKTVAIWGLSFKPNVKDFTRSPALEIIPAILKKGGRIRVYDPMAMDNFQLSYPDESVYYANDELDAALGADAILLLTEWAEFRAPDWLEIKRNMKTPFILDGRNIYDKKQLIDLGFEYVGVGR